MKFFNLLIAFVFIVGVISCNKPVKNKSVQPQNKKPQKVKATAKKVKEVPNSSQKKNVVKKEESTESLLQKKEGPVAKVNGEEITGAQFYAEMSKIVKPKTKIPKNRFKRIQDNILKRMIEKKILKQAIKSNGIKITSQELEKKYQNYKSKFKTDAQFQNYLKYGRTTEQKIKDRLKEQLALKKLLSKKYDFSVKDDEVKAFYEKNKRFYKIRQAVHIKQIVIRVPSNASLEKKKKADEKLALVIKTLKNKPFEEVAKLYSEDITAQKGGDMQIITKGRYLKPVEDVAFMLKIGEISKPIKTRIGYHIIKLIKKIPESIKPFSEVKDRIRTTLENRNYFTSKRKLLEKLKKQAKIERYL